MRQGSSTGSRTMVQRHGIARDLTVCGLFTALTAVGAFIKDRKSTRLNSSH